MRRLPTALALGALAAALVAGPVAAAPRTRWVDDDGKAGPTTCEGTKAAQSTIDGALGPAGVGDTIKVCPGRYVEFPIVATAGITLVSVKTGKAVVAPMSLSSAAAGPRPAGSPQMILVNADRVTIKGFRIDLSATDLCWTSSGINVGAVTGTVLTGNRIVGRSDTSLTCG